METVQLQKVVDLPSVTVFSDSQRQSETTVLEIFWHPDEGPKGKIRFTGTALNIFNAMIRDIPPVTVVRAIFTEPEFRATVAGTPGFEELSV